VTSGVTKAFVELKLDDVTHEIPDNKDINKLNFYYYVTIIIMHLLSASITLLKDQVIMK